MFVTLTRKTPDFVIIIELTEKSDPAKVGPVWPRQSVREGDRQWIG